MSEPIRVLVVDVLFRSVATVFGERTLAAVLTGMGPPPAQFRPHLVGRLSR